MIKSVLAKNFKGRSFEYQLGAKTLITGPNGAGKSAIVQALQLAIEGGVPGVNKTNPAIMEALAGDSPTLYVEATIENGAGRVKIARQFAREKDTVKQIFMVDRRRVDQKAFLGALATAGAPRIIAVDEFLAMSGKKMITYLAGLSGNSDLSTLTDQIEREKASLSALQKKLVEAEAFISKTAESLAKLDLPVGSLSEVQEEIRTREAELDAARISLAEAAARKKAEDEARDRKIAEEDRRRQEAPLEGKDPQTPSEGSQAPPDPCCQHQGELFPGLEKNEPQAAPQEVDEKIERKPPRESNGKSAVASIKAIIATIKEAACPTCKGTAGLLIAKRELRRWEAR